MAGRDAPVAASIRGGQSVCVVLRPSGAVSGIAADCGDAWLPLRSQCCMAGSDLLGDQCGRNCTDPRAAEDILVCVDCTSVVAVLCEIGRASCRERVE